MFVAFEDEVNKASVLADIFKVTNSSLVTHRLIIEACHCHSPPISDTVNFLLLYMNDVMTSV